MKEVLDEICEQVKNQTKPISKSKLYILKPEFRKNEPKVDKKLKKKIDYYNEYSWKDYSENLP